MILLQARVGGRLNSRIPRRRFTKATSEISIFDEHSSRFDPWFLEPCPSVVKDFRQTATTAEVPRAAGRALGAKSIKKKEQKKQCLILSSWDKRTEYARSKTVDQLASELKNHRHLYSEEGHGFRRSIRSVQPRVLFSLD